MHAPKTTATSRKLANLFRDGMFWVDQLIFEHLCPGCQQPPASEDEIAGGGNRFWCMDCMQGVLADDLKCCGRCSAELTTADPNQMECKLCRGADWRFDRVISVGNYHFSLKELVVRMKGLRDQTLAWQLGLLLGERLFDRVEIGEYSAVVPVPGWWRRRLVRGFDGAERIASAIEATTGVPARKNILRCCRKTAKQGTLSISARFRNVVGMFAINRTGCVAGQNVLLVDDVLTSGATASQAASVLKRRGGATRVDVAVIARGTRGI